VTGHEVSERFFGSTLGLKILRVMTMKESLNNAAGIQQIIERYKNRFRVPENLNFYSKEDLVAAERKFLKYAIMNGGFESMQPGDSFGRSLPRGQIA